MDSYKELIKIFNSLTEESKEDVMEYIRLLKLKREKDMKKEIEIKYEIPLAKQYIDLRVKAGMGEKNMLNVKKALENSLFVVSVWKKDELIGLGRIVGDEGISYMVTDIMVDKKYQCRGIGKAIMQEIDDYLEENTDKDAYIILLANKPADKLYSKFNFEYVQPESCGMKRRYNYR